VRGQLRRLLDERSLEKHFQSYAKTAYNAHGEVRTEATTPEALEAPFRLRIEAERASRGTTELTDAAVAIPLAELLDDLPDSLLQNEDEPDSLVEKSGAVMEPYRFEPLVREWLYRIVAPPGFQVAALPHSEVAQLGPARLSKTFAVVPGNGIAISLRFDSGRGSLSLAEFGAMRRALSALRDSAMLMIKFDHIAEAHLAAGRFREAYAEFHRLVALHPGEALHRAQLAYALMEGGLGESARQVAQEAVALEPQNAVAHRLRAIVLMSDLSGQFLSPGWDRAGAIVELRRALSLNPEDRQAQFDLALCLERNAAGTAYGTGADLNAAITEWRALVKRTPKLNYQEELFAALLWAGRHAELDAAVAAIPKGELHNAALLLSTAVNRGGAAAIEAARNRIAGRVEQRTALLKAGETLVGLRNYPLAAALLDEAATDAENTKALRDRAAMLRRLRRYEESTSLSRPTDVMQQYMPRLLLDDVTGAARLRSLFGPQMDTFLASEAWKGMRHHFRSSHRESYASLGYEADALSTLIEPTAEGNEQTGFRVESGGPSGKGMLMFVTRQKGGFRVIGQNEFLQGLGYEAFSHLDRGELAEAHQLLTWAWNVSPPDGPTAAWEPFTLLWRPEDPLDPDQLRIAAAALSCALRKEPGCAEPYRSRAMAILTEASERFSHETYHALALATLFERIDRYSDVLAIVAQLRLRNELDPAGEMLEVLALHKSGQTAIARVRLESMLREIPLYDPYWKLLAELCQDSGDFVNAELGWRKLKELGAPDSLVLPNLSWLAVLTGKVSAETETDARHAVELTKKNNPRILRILAATLLENSKLAEALETLRQVTAMNEGELASADQYLVGRLAERYGERQAAIAAYRRIPVDGKQENGLASLHWLAQKRIAELVKISRNQ
jgi:Flp pilus assembly protein TadD